MNHILIVEDEKPISNLIKLNLDNAGYYCTCAYDGAEAADLIEKGNYDLILLDIMLPKVTGYELMEYIRPLAIPVIFLTAKSDVNEKVKGLKLGADDYLTKPFEIIELLARVEAVLRRYNKLETQINRLDVCIDLPSRVVKSHGEIVNLTIKEYDLLLLFVQNPNIALYRDRIYERIWGDFYIEDSRTVDLHIQRLRKKLGWEDKIVTVFKIGYRLEL
jgi:two-component system alkaline phosphatase synthesis response regulator PhoP